MCSLLEGSKNYRKETGSLWNYYMDEPNSGEDGGINYSIMDSKSFDYKTNFIKDSVTQNNLTKNDVKIAVPLKYLSNFWITLNIPLINCEVELILAWFKNYVLVNKATGEANIALILFSVKLIIQKMQYLKIADAKFYVSVVTLSKENDIKLLEQLKSGFKRTIKWNKYRSQMTVQPQNNYLNYLIDPTFTNVNRLFVLSFARTNSGDNRYIFSDYYVPNIEIKDFNILIYGKSFFDLPVKNEDEAYEKIMDMSNNNDYTTVNLLYFAYFKENYRLIAIGLYKQTKLKDLQQISFVGKL